MRSQTWRFHGRFRSLDLQGPVEHAAKALINLVNIQGAGVVCVEPSNGLVAIRDALHGVPGYNSWRHWWHVASGEELVVSERCTGRYREPIQTYHHSATDSGAYLGVNVGGRYLRLVWVQDGKVEARKTLPLVNNGSFSIGAMTTRSFVDLMQSRESLAGLQGIGIAWSAPRTIRGLRAMSVQSRGLGELSTLLDRGSLDEVLSDACGCPVRSWNDGEAVAAAEAMARKNSLTRPLLVLKLGSSLASGIALKDGVSLLPTQLSKCLVDVKPVHTFRHPSVGLHGSARDLVGAASIAGSYRLVSGEDGADYLDFCRALLIPSSEAHAILRTSASAIVDLALLASYVWEPLDLVLTGKNVEVEIVRRLLLECVREELAERCTSVRLLSARVDFDTSAAIGAVALSHARTAGAAGRTRK